MHIIYVSAQRSKSKTAVRVELVGDDSVVEYYFIDESLRDKAKLIAIEEFLQAHPLPKESSLSIYLDSPDLEHNWKYVYTYDMEFVENRNEWAALFSLLKRLKYIPDVRASGILSGSMRDELRAYLEERNPTE